MCSRTISSRFFLSSGLGATALPPDHAPDEAARDGQRMARSRLQAPGDTRWFPRDAELLQDGGGVVVDAFPDQRVPLEDEDRQEPLLEAATCRGQPAQRPGGRSPCGRLHQDRLVGVVERDDLDLLVRTGAVALLPLCPGLLRTVVDLVRGDVLVAGVLEGRKRRL